MSAFAARVWSIGRRQPQNGWTLELFSSDNRNSLCAIRFDNFESLKSYIVEAKERGSREKLIMDFPSCASESELQRLFWLGVH
ncbi:MAG: hypothetical protein WBD60_06245, partial [Methylovirgula sp.]